MSRAEDGSCINAEVKNVLGVENVRQAKKLTRNQKIFLKERGLNYENWLCVEDSPMRLVIRNKVSDKERTLERV